MAEEVEVGTYHNGYEIRATQYWQCEVLDDKGKVVNFSDGYRSYEEALDMGRAVINNALPELGQEQ